MTVIYFDEPTVIVAGGIEFGPYGPGQCQSRHPHVDVQCKHHDHHVGGHASWEIDTPSGTVTYRWR